MIVRRILHIEVHRGYRPHVSLRREPRHGDRVLNGGEPGVLAACPTCSGSGFLHVPDKRPPYLYERPEPTPWSGP